MDEALLHALIGQRRPAAASRAGLQPRHFLRTFATPHAIKTWSLTSLRERLIKTNAWLVWHARYAVFQFAEAALPREVFGGVLDLIAGLRGPPAETASA